MNLGICDCGKWGITPKEFKENKHFLECVCGSLMYLTRNTKPEELGLAERNKITPLITNQ